MANFHKAFEKTALHEGGYANDPDDIGGETYKGIARQYHPSWEGWTTIDQIKSSSASDREINEKCSRNQELQESVQSFYKIHFWDRFLGDRILSQEIAEELFDTGVNMGIHCSVEFLQESLNLLNRNQKDYDDITEDGILGSATLNALDQYLENDDASFLLKIMNILQGYHYIEYMRRRPNQEKYARGWLKRVAL
ncbi:hypothetical protein JW824_08055 [bacterium]|nr:hypothetical protein [bacterium]